MATVIHADSALTCAEDTVCELLSYDESPESPGLTRRFLSVSDMVLISAFVFTRRDGTKRCRFAARILKVPEARAYRAKMNALNVGAGI
jgi:hypothetical protein